MEIATVARYKLKIPDYDVDVGEFVELTVNADSEADARRSAARQMPGVAWDCADCVLMSNGDR